VNPHVKKYSFGKHTWWLLQDRLGEGLSKASPGTANRLPPKQSFMFQRLFQSSCWPRKASTQTARTDQEQAAPIRPSSLNPVSRSLAGASKPPVNMQSVAYDASSESRRVARGENGSPSEATTGGAIPKVDNAPPPSIKHTAPKSPLLFDALNEKNWELAEALVCENHGLLYTSQVHNGNSVLHAAVLNNAPTHLVKMLLEKGADPNLNNGWNRTPVYIGARHNVQPETMRTLAGAGGDVNRIDRFQYTPLMASSYNGASLSLVGALLALGADRMTSDGMGKLAQDWATEGDNPEIATYLGNIGTIETLLCIYLPRVGSKSPLHVFTKDLMRALRDMLCVPNRPIRVKPPPAPEG
jgi:hypothetical protein